MIGSAVLAQRFQASSKLEDHACHGDPVVCPPAPAVKEFAHPRPRLGTTDSLDLMTFDDTANEAIIRRANELAVCLGGSTHGRRLPPLGIYQHESVRNQSTVSYDTTPTTLLGSSIPTKRAVRIVRITWTKRLFWSYSKSAIVVAREFFIVRTQYHTYTRSPPFTPFGYLTPHPPPL